MDNYNFFLYLMNGIYNTELRNARSPRCTMAFVDLLTRENDTELTLDSLKKTEYFRCYIFGSALVLMLLLIFQLSWLRKRLQLSPLSVKQRLAKPLK